MEDIKTILIADDSTSNKAILQQALNDYYDIIMPFTVKHFLREIEENSENISLIIVSDTSKMFNIEELLKEDTPTNNMLKEKIASIPLMIMSSNITQCNIMKTLKNEIFDYIVRPFNKELLLNRIKNIIQLSTVAKETSKKHTLNVLREQNTLKQEMNNSFGSISFKLQNGEIINSDGFIKKYVEDCKFFREFQSVLTSLTNDTNTKNRIIKNINVDNFRQVILKESSTIKENLKLVIDGKRYFLNVLCKGYDDPVSNTLCGIIVFFDKTTEVLNNKIYSLLYTNHYELTSIINVKSLDCSLRTYNKEFGLFDENNVSYDEFVEKLTNLFHMTKDIGGTRFSINNLVNGLANKKYLENTYSYTEDDLIVTKTIKCQYIDDSKKEILVWVEDISDKFITDSLTGGYNYQGFIINGKKVINNSKDILTVIYCNIASYKRITELVGSDGGRVLLNNIYNVLVNSKLKPLCIGRNHDAFFMIVKKNNNVTSVLDNLSEYMFINEEKQFKINLKFGLIDILERDADLISLCDKATLAEVEIENDIFNNYYYYNKSITKEYINSSEVIDSIDKAITNNELCAYYQPIVNTKTEKVELTETLVRWNHPEYGIIKPDNFIPILEKNGLAYKVDKIILNSVKKVKEKYQEVKDIGISVNISRADFYVDEMIDLIHETLKDNTLFKSIYYEVTESFDLELSNETVTLMDWIQKHGSKILLDDFGYKYSTFNTLLDAKFDMIKIYSGLTNQIGKNNLAENAIKAIIQMAHSSKMKIVAEGIETKEQVMFLKENDCDYIQGYYYSKALKEEDYLEYVKKINK